MSSADTRSGSTFSAEDGLISGGSGESVTGHLGRSSGDEGSVVKDCGEGAVGGGRWMKVRLSSGNAVTVAFGLFIKGSGALYGGRSAVPGFGRGHRVA